MLASAVLSNILDLQYVCSLESLPFSASNGYLLVHLESPKAFSKGWRHTSLPFHIAPPLCGSYNEYTITIRLTGRNTESPLSYLVPLHKNSCFPITQCLASGYWVEVFMASGLIWGWNRLISKRRRDGSTRNKQDLHYKSNNFNRANFLLQTPALI